jgi:hypothetical protein
VLRPTKLKRFGTEGDAPSNSGEYLSPSLLRRLKPSTCFALPHGAPFTRHNTVPSRELPTSHQSPGMYVSFSLPAPDHLVEKHPMPFCRMMFYRQASLV